MTPLDQLISLLRLREAIDDMAKATAKIVDIPTGQQLDELQGHFGKVDWWMSSLLGNTKGPVGPRGESGPIASSKEEV